MSNDLTNENDHYIHYQKITNNHSTMPNQKLKIIHFSPDSHKVPTTTNAKTVLIHTKGLNFPPLKLPNFHPLNNNPNKITPKSTIPSPPQYRKQFLYSSGTYNITSYCIIIPAATSAAFVPVGDVARKEAGRGLVWKISTSYKSAVTCEGAWLEEARIGRWRAKVTGTQLLGRLPLPPPPPWEISFQKIFHESP